MSCEKDKINLKEKAPLGVKKRCYFSTDFDAC